MFIAFRNFRKIILGLIVLVSTASLVLSLYLKPSFTHPNSAYVMVGILDTLIFASILAMTRRWLLQSPQSVATETLGLFTLLPFALSEYPPSSDHPLSDSIGVLTLYVLTLSVDPGEPTVLWIFAILQILIFIGTILREFSFRQRLLFANVLHRRSLHNRPHLHCDARRLCVRSGCLESSHRLVSVAFSDDCSILVYISLLLWTRPGFFPERRRTRLRASKPCLSTWLQLLHSQAADPKHIRDGSKSWVGTDA